ncbi:NUDIX domain-containing protein [Empedobacter falsenii]|uniref:NUDIX domain-containing protein n=2 Tax=Empedobacter TaxID=59734 RepID=A0ABY8V5Z9_9FLAO|nr:MULTISPECIES: NUDIX domain-containing protein [Empedobacter]MCA4777926.1 NUDIX domain-containing protein [Empedobacter stercoris]MCA4783265.1 NUDIX domain-containing protein [Empedobacter stercoris]MCA4809427.1 NUDIX domain-containing protein [Empedobacter stercoris]MDM1523529.1 NUDIX domain-containing protein [Empedobacter sp. 225-1]MDM1543473.1 NUDIX domain-containing protein [Empedobacter sp. 189-2]
MYKVFFNESLLTFSNQSNPEAKNILFQNEAQFDESVHLLSSKASNLVNIFSDDIETVWTKFLKYYKHIQAAGGIVRNPKDDYLFIFRLGKWDLPKGKMEEGESREESAIREIEEECSLTNLELKRFLMPTFHIYFLREYIIKETFWFEVFYDGVELPLPQTEEGIESVEWRKESEIPQLLENSYPNIKLLMDNYLNLN